MKRSLRQIQKRLIELNFSVGRSGADGRMGRDTEAAIRAFQHSRGLFVDGDAGPLTEAALFPDTASDPQTISLESSVPADWMPKADIDRVIVHWTAGQHRASSGDREHYHILVESDGRLVRGIPTIDKNDASGARSGYAAHTLHCNTGSAGVSMCAMVGAVESPFSPGPAPLTQAQWDAMTRVVADLCLRYGIPVTDRTVLTHAEVQPSLGITQKGKWDVTRLPFDPKTVGHRAVGDLLRRQVAALMK